MTSTIWTDALGRFIVISASDGCDPQFLFLWLYHAMHFYDGVFWRLDGFSPRIDLDRRDANRDIHLAVPM